MLIALAAAPGAEQKVDRQPERGPERAVEPEAGSVFVSRDLGFSMEVPVTPDAEAPFYQVAMFHLPPEDGFSANVNLQKQRYPGSLAAYDKLSVEQFEAMGLTMIQRDIADGVITYEYQGKMQGKLLHWYARAMKRGDSVYLITATSPAVQWEKHQAKLMRSVDSFALTE